jgi:hypothetical protein
VGVSTYFDISDKIKSGVLTPSYRFSPALALKARLPLIFSRTLNIWDVDYSAGGLGDITLDGEYTRYLGNGHSLLRFSASVKLPTGDDEATDEKSTASRSPCPWAPAPPTTSSRPSTPWAKPAFGLVSTVMYRKNTPSETMADLGGYIETTETTMPNQLLLSTFGRKRLNQKFSLNLGVAASFLGDGKRVSTYSDGRDDFDYGANMGGTLVDLFPGISYNLGKLNPYLGVRIPVVTSYDNETRDEERDVAFLFQFSYRPEKMGQ